MQKLASCDTISPWSLETVGCSRLCFRDLLNPYPAFHRTLSIALNCFCVLWPDKTLFSLWLHVTVSWPGVHPELVILRAAVACFPVSLTPSTHRHGPWAPSAAASALFMSVFRVPGPCQMRNCWINERSHWIPGVLNSDPVFSVSSKSACCWKLWFLDCSVSTPNWIFLTCVQDSTVNSDIPLPFLAFCSERCAYSLQGLPSTQMPDGIQLADTLVLNPLYGFPLPLSGPSLLSVRGLRSSASLILPSHFPAFRPASAYEHFHSRCLVAEVTVCVCIISACAFFVSVSYFHPVYTTQFCKAYEWAHPLPPSHHFLLFLRPLCFCLFLSFF